MELFNPTSCHATHTRAEPSNCCGSGKSYVAYTVGYKNCVSLEGKNITSHQVKLVKRAKSSIVFAWIKMCQVQR